MHRALTRLEADLGSIKQASALPVRDSLQGNDAINRATDTFLRDLALAPLDNLVRNRLIDHAAALLFASCEQCFQALEASRPIVAIEHAHTGTGAGTSSGARSSNAGACPWSSAAEQRMVVRRC